MPHIRVTAEAHEAAQKAEAEALRFVKALIARSEERAYQNA